MKKCDDCGERAKYRYPIRATRQPLRGCILEVCYDCAVEHITPWKGEAAQQEIARRKECKA